MDTTSSRSRGRQTLRELLMEALAYYLCANSAHPVTVAHRVGLNGFTVSYSGDTYEVRVSVRKEEP